MSSSYLMNLLASAVAVIVGIVIHEAGLGARRQDGPFARPRVAQPA